MTPYAPKAGLAADVNAKPMGVRKPVVGTDFQPNGASSQLLDNKSNWCNNNLQNVSFN